MSTEDMDQHVRHGDFGATTTGIDPILRARIPWVVLCTYPDKGAAYIFDLIDPFDSMYSVINAGTALIWLQGHLQHCPKSVNEHFVSPALDPYEMGGS